MKLTSLLVKPALTVLLDNLCVFSFTNKMIILGSYTSRGHGCGKKLI